MKSIKEKAEEYSLIEEGIDLKDVPYKDYNNYKMEGFEAGANYVLECLERAIDLNESTFVYSREKYIKVQVLNELIEKLKKK